MNRSFVSVSTTEFANWLTEEFVRRIFFFVFGALFPALSQSSRVTHACKMPVRDTKGRFCGTLHRKQADNNWQRNYFVLDEDKCLLRYFSIMNAKVSENFQYCFALFLSFRFRLSLCSLNYHTIRGAHYVPLESQHFRLFNMFTRTYFDFIISLNCTATGKNRNCCD